MCWANFADFEAEKVSRAFLHPFPSLRSLKKAYPTVDNSEQTPKFLQKKLRKQKQNLLLLFLQLHPPSKKREQPQLFRKKKKKGNDLHTLSWGSKSPKIIGFQPQVLPKLLQGFQGQFCRCVGFCPFTGSQQCIGSTLEVVGRLERLVEAESPGPKSSEVFLGKKHGVCFCCLLRLPPKKTWK